MKKKLTGIALALGVSGAFASAAQAGVYKCSQDEINARVRVDAAFDLKTGTQIYGDADTDKRFTQASMTKRLIEYFTYEQLSSGRLNRTDIVYLPGSRLTKADGSEKEWGDRIPFEIGKGKRSERIVSVSVNDALLAMKEGSSNRAAIGLAVKLFGTEDNAVREMNKWVRAQNLQGLAAYANTTGYQTVAMNYAPHYTTPFAHAFIVWKIHTQFPDMVNEFAAANLRITTYTELGRAVPMNISPTTRFSNGKEIGHFKVMDFKTGTTCLAGTGIDVVVKDEASGREIVYITAGHDPNAGTKNNNVAEFFTHMPENARARLENLAMMDSFPGMAGVELASSFSVRESFAQHALRSQSLFDQRHGAYDIVRLSYLYDPMAKSCPVNPVPLEILSLASPRRAQTLLQSPWRQPQSYMPVNYSSFEDAFSPISVTGFHLRPVV